MHQKKTIKKLLRLIFILIQTLIFLSAISIAVIFITIFYKSRDFIHFNYFYFLFLALMTTCAISATILGLRTINSKKKVKLFGFIFLTLILMNLQIIIAIKSSFLPEKSINWGDHTWEKLSDYQKEFIQSKFECCGFRDGTDRNVGTCDSDSTGCLNVLYKGAINTRSVIEKSLILLFFIESTGLSIITMLKLRK